MELRLSAWEIGQVMVARPTGQLDLSSYAALRDGLLKCVADQPAALVVDIHGLEVSAPTSLTVFSSVWMRVAQWPGIPLLLVVHRNDLLALVRQSGIARFVPIFPSVVLACAGLGHVPAVRWRQIRLPPAPLSVLRARLFVTEVCLEWEAQLLVADALAVAAELVENSVRHAGSELRLRLELRRHGLSIAVRDLDSRVPRAARSPRRPPPAGSGLAMVAELASVWGCIPTIGGGKVVWAILPS